AALNGREVGEQAAQPALVHEVHAAALRLFGDDVLRLTFGPDEQDCASFGGKVRHEFFGLAEQLHRLAEVDDVDAVALAEDVLLPLRVPALGLVAAAPPRLQQILHRDRGRTSATLAPAEAGPFRPRASRTGSARARP